MTDTYEGKDRTSPAPSSGLCIIPHWPILNPNCTPAMPDWFRAVTVETWLMPDWFKAVTVETRRRCL